MLRLTSLEYALLRECLGECDHGRSGTFYPNEESVFTTLEERGLSFQTECPHCEHPTEELTDLGRFALRVEEQVRMLLAFEPVKS